jgi:hypothetical protein
MKNSAPTTCVFLAHLIFFLLFGAAMFQLQRPASAQSLVSNDVKHDTPGQPIKPGQVVHVDVNLALVSSPITSASSKTMSSKKS